MRAGRTRIAATYAVAGLIAACALATSAPAAFAAARPDLTGVWAMRFREYVKTDEGQLPPMRPAALAGYNARVAKLQAGEQVPDSATACLPHGMPRIMYTPYPMQIIQRPEVIAFLFEVNHNIRVAYVDKPLPQDPDPTYMGYSNARWEGSTLVVETAGLNNKIQVDRAGLPQGEKMHVTERFDLSADGKKLKNRITVNDPDHYTAPWSFTIEYNKADYPLMEYVCENNRSRVALRDQAGQ